VTDAPVIELVGVTFGYEGVPVIEEADLKVPAGAFASIVGPNGGGKTTLLKLILGMLQPDHGTVRVLGEPPAQVRPRIGYMPQSSRHDPLFPVTVMDVVLMGRLTAGSAGPYSRADRRAAEQALVDVGLPELRGWRMADLSGGQRQRVLVARALCSNPELLLLDEPTAGVDSPAEDRLLRLLAELNSRMTILMVSHDLGFVSQIVRHVICVNRRVRVHATTDLTGEHIRELYGAPVRMVRHGDGDG
jgi:zinc transport system ATP-binding protein